MLPNLNSAPDTLPKLPNKSIRYPNIPLASSFYYMPDTLKVIYSFNSEIFPSLICTIWLCIKKWSKSSSSNGLIFNSGAVNYSSFDLMSEGSDKSSFSSSLAFHKSIVSYSFYITKDWGTKSNLLENTPTDMTKASIFMRKVRDTCKSMGTSLTLATSTMWVILAWSLPFSLVAAYRISKKLSLDCLAFCPYRLMLQRRSGTNYYFLLSWRFMLSNWMRGPNKTYIDFVALMSSI